MEVPETVVIKCQNLIYLMMDEAEICKNKVAARKEELQEADESYRYKLKECRDMIQFLVENTYDDPDEERKSHLKAEYEAALEQRIADDFKKIYTGLTMDH